MKIHFIAIGGSAMHNLAIALREKGYTITGSDDEIFEPSRSRLAGRGLLPEEQGWFPGKLDERPDAVILGMHARADNPELQRAKELGIKVYSYPEYLFEHAKDKTRIVIGGSHGKTTITAMVLHVLRYCGRNADYLVGSGIEGFDVMVRLSDSAPVMVLEGDEYLTSAIDRRPKFHLYRPHLALLSGIAWDHINVFTTWEGYIAEFAKFIDLIEPGGTIVYCSGDSEVMRLVKNARSDLKKVAYGLPRHIIRDGMTHLVTGDRQTVALRIFGKHNLMNLEGARMVCAELGIDRYDFYAAAASFPGASNRLELLAAGDYCSVYRDFAHSPSKLRATVEAVKEQFRGRSLTACMELHTYSSLSKNFLSHYSGTLDSADTPIVYFNPHALEIKQLPPLEVEQVKKAFDNERTVVLTDSGELERRLEMMEWKERNLLLMSSGNFDNIDLKGLAERITLKT